MVKEETGWGGVYRRETGAVVIRIYTGKVMDVGTLHN